MNKYAKELLAAMSSGMEEKDDPGQPTADCYCVKDKRKVAAIFCVVLFMSVILYTLLASSSFSELERFSFKVQEKTHDCLLPVCR